MPSVTDVRRVETVAVSNDQNVPSPQDMRKPRDPAALRSPPTRSSTAPLPSKPILALATANSNGNADDDDVAKSVPNTPATYDSPHADVPPVNHDAAHQYPVVAWDVTVSSGPFSYPLLFRASPWKLMYRDFRFLVTHAYMLPWLLLPRQKNVQSKFQSKGDSNIWSTIGLNVMLLFSLLLTTILVLGVIIAPPLVLIGLPLTLLFIWAAQKLQKGRFRNTYDPKNVGQEKEAWFFINGVGTTGHGSEAAAERLQEMFHRPVTAVLNRSLGIWWDLLECILQRDLLLITPDIRAGYGAIRRTVLDKRKERIVIIGHSQGGIILSSWIDQLLCDVPNSLLSRVEVYTFASASNHFSRPAASMSGVDQPFRHVEHFANEHDFVARFGVLGFAPAPGEVYTGAAEAEDNPELDEIGCHNCEPARIPFRDKYKHATEAFDDWWRSQDHPLPNTRGDYGGRIFLRRKHKGHFLLQHYLHENDSFLDDPFVRKHSQLARYLGGGHAL